MEDINFIYHKNSLTQSCDTMHKSVILSSYRELHQIPNTKQTDQESVSTWLQTQTETSCDCCDVPVPLPLLQIIKRTAQINEDFKKFPNVQRYTMPVITIYFGPYESNGIVRHRPQKLHGLIGNYFLCNFKKIFIKRIETC